MAPLGAERGGDGELEVQSSRKLGGAWVPGRVVRSRRRSTGSTGRRRLRRHHTGPSSDLLSLQPPSPRPLKDPQRRTRAEDRSERPSGGARAEFGLLSSLGFYLTRRQDFARPRKVARGARIG